MREWIKQLSEIDRDCIEHYEYLLGRELRDKAEYKEIDGQVEEMILEWDSLENLLEQYPTLEKYLYGGN